MRRSIRANNEKKNLKTTENDDETVLLIQMILIEYYRWSRIMHVIIALVKVYTIDSL